MNSDAVFCCPFSRQHQELVRSALQVDRRQPKSYEAVIAGTEALEHRLQVLGFEILKPEVRTLQKLPSALLQVTGQSGQKHVVLGVDQSMLIAVAEGVADTHAYVAIGR